MSPTDPIATAPHAPPHTTAAPVRHPLDQPGAGTDPLEAQKKAYRQSRLPGGQAGRVVPLSQQQQLDQSMQFITYAPGSGMNPAYVRAHNLRVLQARRQAGRADVIKDKGGWNLCSPTYFNRAQAPWYKRFGSALYNLATGATLGLAAAMVKGFFCDENGEFSWWSTFKTVGMMVGMGVLLATPGLGWIAMGLAAYGTLSSAAHVIKTGVDLFNMDGSNPECDEKWNELGTHIANTLLGGRGFIRAKANLMKRRLDKMKEKLDEHRIRQVDPYTGEVQLGQRLSPEAIFKQQLREHNALSKELKAAVGKHLNKTAKVTQEDVHKVIHELKAKPIHEWTEAEKNLYGYYKQMKVLRHDMKDLAKNVDAIKEYRHAAKALKQEGAWGKPREQLTTPEQLAAYERWEQARAGLQQGVREAKELAKEYKALKQQLKNTRDSWGGVLDILKHPITTIRNACGELRLKNITGGLKEAWEYRFKRPYKELSGKPEWATKKWIEADIEEINLPGRQVATNHTRFRVMQERVPLNKTARAIKASEPKNLRPTDEMNARELRQLKRQARKDALKEQKRKERDAKRQKEWEVYLEKAKKVVPLRPGETVESLSFQRRVLRYYRFEGAMKDLSTLRHGQMKETKSLGELLKGSVSGTARNGSKVQVTNLRDMAERLKRGETIQISQLNPNTNTLQDITIRSWQDLFNLLGGKLGYQNVAQAVKAAKKAGLPSEALKELQLNLFEQRNLRINAIRKALRTVDESAEMHDTAKGLRQALKIARDEQARDLNAMLREAEGSPGMFNAALKEKLAAVSKAFNEGNTTFTRYLDRWQQTIDRDMAVAKATRNAQKLAEAKAEQRRLNDLLAADKRTRNYKRYVDFQREVWRKRKAKLEEWKKYPKNIDPAKRAQLEKELSELNQRYANAMRAGADQNTLASLNAERIELRKILYGGQIGTTTTSELEMLNHLIQTPGRAFLNTQGRRGWWSRTWKAVNETCNPVKRVGDEIGSTIPGGAMSGLANKLRAQVGEPVHPDRPRLIRRLKEGLAKTEDAEAQNILAQMDQERQMLQNAPGWFTRFFRWRKTSKLKQARESHAERQLKLVEKHYGKDAEVKAEFDKLLAKADEPYKVVSGGVGDWSVQGRFWRIRQFFRSFRKEAWKDSTGKEGDLAKQQPLWEKAKQTVEQRRHDAEQAKRDAIEKLKKPKPDGVDETTEAAGMPDAKKEAKLSWEEKMSGIGNVFKTAFQDAGRYFLKPGNSSHPASARNPFRFDRDPGASRFSPSDRARQLGNLGLSAWEIDWGKVIELPSAATWMYFQQASPSDMVNPQSRINKLPMFPDYDYDVDGTKIKLDQNGNPIILDMPQSSLGIDPVTGQPTTSPVGVQGYPPPDGYGYGQSGLLPGQVSGSVDLTGGTRSYA